MSDQTQTYRKKSTKETHPNIRKVCSILGIDYTTELKVLDTKGIHSLIHYDDKANMRDFGDYRGVIIDTESEEIVCKTYGYMPEFEHDKLETKKNSKGEEVLMLNGIGSCTDVTVPFKSSIIFRGHEGALINIWKDRKGVVHASGMKKIDCSKSKWGNSLTYLDIYKDLGGPDFDTFFDKDKVSPFVHTIIISHPDLYNVTKEVATHTKIVEDSGSGNIQLTLTNHIESVGYIVYLGAKKMNINFGAVPAEDVEATPKPIDTVNNIKDARKERKIYGPVPIDLELANYHLRYGFYKEWKDDNVTEFLRNGEFLVINNKYRILSPAYYWRSRMRAHNHILCNMFRLACHSKDTRHFDDGFFPHLHVQDIEKLGKLINKGTPIQKYSTDTALLDLNNPRDRLINIWLCYILAVPIHRQQEVYDCLREYETLLTKGAQQAYDIYYSSEKYSCLDKVLRLVQTVQHRDSVINKDVKKYKGARSSNNKQENLVSVKNIRFTLRTMNGKKAYNIIRNMQKDQYKLEITKRGKEAKKEEVQA